MRKMDIGRLTAEAEANRMRTELEEALKKMRKMDIGRLTAEAEANLQSLGNQI